MKISVCIPMYNEKNIIAETAVALSSYMQSHFDDYEILFCNDGSLDGCDRTVMDLQLPHVRVIGYEQNRGKGHAIRYAMLQAKGDIRLFTDADLAYGTDIIKQLTDVFENNSQTAIVIGSRNLTKDGYAGYTWLRKLASKIYIRILCMLGGFRISDSQCGCKAFSAQAAESIFSRCEVDSFAFDFEVILWAKKLGFAVQELPVCVLHHGQSTVHMVRDSFRMLRDIIKMKKRIRKTSI